jgi:hypothetical protein
LGHRSEDVGIAEELALDEDLGQRRPVGHLGKRGALGHVLEHVHDFERVTEVVEKLDRFHREAAQGRVFGALAVDENGVVGDLTFDLAADRVGHLGLQKVGAYG